MASEEPYDKRACKFRFRNGCTSNHQRQQFNKIKQKFRSNELWNKRKWQKSVIKILDCEKNYKRKIKKRVNEKHEFNENNGKHSNILYMETSKKIIKCNNNKRSSNQWKSMHHQHKWKFSKIVKSYKKVEYHQKEDGMDEAIFSIPTTIFSTPTNTATIQTVPNTKQTFNKNEKNACNVFNVIKTKQNELFKCGSGEIKRKFLSENIVKRFQNEKFGCLPFAANVNNVYQYGTARKKQSNDRSTSNAKILSSVGQSIRDADVAWSSTGYRKTSIASTSIGCSPTSWKTILRHILPILLLLSAFPLLNAG